MFQVEKHPMWDIIHSEAKYKYGKLGEGSVRELRIKYELWNIFKFPFLQEVLCSITTITIYHKLILFYTFDNRKYLIETLHLFEQL